MAGSRDSVYLRFPHWGLLTRWEGATDSLAAAVAARWRGVIAPPLDGDSLAAQCPRIELVVGRTGGNAARALHAQEAIAGGGWTVYFVAGRGSIIFFVSERAEECIKAVRGAGELALIHALALHGAAVVHACCFSFSGQAVLALGASHAGKSTLTAAVLAAGGRVVTDDSAVVTLDQCHRPFVTYFRQALIFRDDMREGVLKNWAHVLRPVAWCDGTRWMVKHVHLNQSGLAETAIDQVWLLADRRDKASRVLARPSAAEVLATALQGSAPLFVSRRFPQEREALLPVLRMLSEGLPVFRVATGPDLLVQPELVLRALLETTARQVTEEGPEALSRKWG